MARMPQRRLQGSSGACPVLARCVPIRRRCYGGDVTATSLSPCVAPCPVQARGGCARLLPPRPTAADARDAAPCRLAARPRRGADTRLR